MARLLVDAVTAESTTSDEWWKLQLGVSVSRADTGAPVTGLTGANFRLTSLLDGLLLDYKVVGAAEGKWEPQDATSSGCYRLNVSLEPQEEFTPGKRYVFGVQVRTFNSSMQPVDQGQTVLEAISLGK